MREFLLRKKFLLVFLSKTEDIKIQFIRYIFVGGFAFLVDFGLLFVFTEFFKIYYLISAILSFIAGLTVNYILSTIWVFSNRKLQSKAAEFTIFALIGVIGLGINEFFIWLFTDECGIYYLLSKIFSTGIVFLWNFLARRYILFNK